FFFQQKTAYEMAGMGVAVGDYLHTGRPSLVVANFALDNSPLFRNDGEWSFEDVSYLSGIGLPSVRWVKWGDAFVDLDNDGWLDLITVNGHVYPQVDTLSSGARYRQPKLVQFNQGDGTFCDASDQAGPAILEPRVSRGLAVRSEEHTSALQSRGQLVCRLLLEKKNHLYLPLES